MADGGWCYTALMNRLGSVLRILAHWLGQLQAWVLLTMVYVVLIGPLALILKWSSDPLGLRRVSRAGWHAAKEQPNHRWQWAKAQS